MSLETNNFEFGEYVLDEEEKMLLRHGEPVQLTPKAFQLLLILLKRHGHLVKREDLMEAVWGESFVEEANLTFTVRLLRKALGDRPQNPSFIKTVPRHGYKFIAPVNISPVKSDLSPSGDEVFKKTAQPGYGSPRQYVVAVIGLLLMMVTVGWYLKVTFGATPPRILILPFTAEKLSNSGKIHHTALSPNGKTVIYTNSSGGQQSIWQRQLETGSNVQLIPPSDIMYSGLAFASDSESFYFVRSNGRSSELVRMPVGGGIPQTIVENSQGWIGVSPDGKKISFVRYEKEQKGLCSLWMVDSADGRNERKLYSVVFPMRISANYFSADGKSLVFAVGQSANQSNEFGLMKVDLESGELRELTPEKFFDIKGLARLSGSEDWLITAARIPSRNFHLWQVSALDGKVRQISRDTENYSNLSLSADSSLLVTTQVKADFQLRIYQTDNPSVNRTLVNAENANFSPDQKLVFASEMSGNMEIWATEINGSRQIQLTNDPGDDSSPLVAPDGNSIVFTSNRNGEAHLWRMNADGSNPIQITKKNGGYPIFISSDGKWIYYIHGVTRALWRITSNGDLEQAVIERAKNDYAIAPDGSAAAFSEKRNEREYLSIISLATGKIINEFPAPAEHGVITRLSWMPDGTGVYYLEVDKETKNYALWRQLSDGGEPQKINEFTDESISFISDLAISPDGKSLVVCAGGWRHDAVLLKGLK